MKRLFYQIKVYDYTSEREAEKDIEKMKEKGYFAERRADGKYIYNNGQDEFSYSVKYNKGRKF